MASFLEHPLTGHLLTAFGMLLAAFAFARLLSERRQPSNAMAWMLAILLIPYIGVPLYLIFGGRKLRKLASRKRPVTLDLEGIDACTSAASALPTAHAVNAGGNYPVVGCNRVRFLTTGEAAFEALVENIRNARESIHITTFILGRDDTGRRLVRLLAERARAGVRVRLLLDAVGCLFSSGRFVDPIRAAGGEVHRFMPVLPIVSFRRSANLRNHRKIAIFDQQIAIVGGHNFAREYMGATPFRRRWHDFGAVISGPAVSLVSEIFHADWNFASGETLKRPSRPPPADRSLRGESELQVVASGPDVAGDPLYEGIVSMIQEAERSIWIVTPYFIPDEVLFRSLLVKARAGCDVRLILPARSNHPITDFARRYYVRELQRAGATICLCGPSMMHSKGVIVDDRIGLLGSANFDMRSLFVNFEIGVFVYSPRDIDAMRAWAGDLLRHTRPQPLERRRKYRLAGNVLEELSRLLAPLL